MKESASAILILLLLFPAVTRASMEGPWSVSDEAPVLSDRNLAPPKRTGHTHPVDPLVWLVRGFQNFISPVDGERCAMYPTCSGYSVSALRKHGPLAGFVMTADRIMHETDEGRFAPGIMKYGVYRIYDPVEANDFWWYGKGAGK